MSILLLNRLGAQRWLGSAAVAMVAMALSAAPSLAAAGEQTVVILEDPISLEKVVEQLSASTARVVELRHSGANEGGYRLGALETLDVAAAAEYRAAYRSGPLAVPGGEPQITEVIFAGTPTLDQLGAFADLVDERHSVNTSQSTDDESAQSGGTAPASYEQPRHSWAPDHGYVQGSNVGGSKPRSIYHQLTWSAAFPPSNFGEDVYEHDFKLYNYDNRLPAHPFCFGEADNFWATADGVAWATNFPSSADAYFDDARSSDSCEVLDLTVGVFHPKRLSAGVTYKISVQAEAGTKSSSTFSVTGQSLNNNCPGFNSPKCVNLDEKAVNQPLVGAGVGARVPGCRSWRAGYNSDPC